MIELSTLGVAVVATVFVLLVYWGVLAFLAAVIEFIGRRGG